MTKPCDELCPKCGSSDVVRRWIAAVAKEAGDEEQ